MEINGKLLIIGKYCGLLVVLGFLLKLFGLNEPWSFKMPVQVWVGSIITGTLCLIVGMGWKDHFAKNGKQQALKLALTQREKEVAALVIAGKSNKEICSELFIEHNTLKTHIRNIYKKADCTNRNEFTSIFEQ